MNRWKSSIQKSGFANRPRTRIAYRTWLTCLCLSPAPSRTPHQISSPSRHECVVDAPVSRTESYRSCQEARNGNQMRSGRFFRHETRLGQRGANRVPLQPDAQEIHDILTSCLQRALVNDRPNASVPVTGRVSICDGTVLRAKVNVALAPDSPIYKPSLGCLTLDRRAKTEEICSSRPQPASLASLRLLPCWKVRFVPVPTFR